MKQLAWITFSLSVLSLAIGIAMEDAWLWLIPLAGNTLIGMAFKERQMSSFWLFSQIMIAAVSGAPPVLGLLGVAFGLAAWDLAAFKRLIHSMDQFFNLEEFVRGHQRSLLLAVGSGTILALASFGLTLRLNFPAAVVIAMLSLAGIVLLTGRARSRA